MKGYSNALRKLAFLLSALVLSMCLFAALASTKLANTLFDAELHKKTLNQSDVYSQTGNIAKSSLDGYLKSLDAGPPESLKQQEQLVSFIQKAITPEMIKLNIDSIMDGLLKYFKSETRFLPDIYINPVQDKPLDELQTATEKDDKVSGDSLTKIDKINLSVILMYMNRTDITDKLSVVRLFEFILAKIPLLAVLLLSLALLSGLLLIKNKNELTRWVKITFTFAGSIFTVSGIALLIYLYFILPANHSYIALTVPLQAETAVAYIQNWLNTLTLFFLCMGAASFLLLPLSRLLINFLSKRKKIARLKESPLPNHSGTEICVKKRSIKPVFAVISLVSVFLLSFLFYGSIKGEFLSKDLSVAVDRMKGITAFSRVVFAQDAAVNTLELRMVDRKTNTPVQGVYTNISGISAVSGKSFNEAVTSDPEGKSIITLDIGSYKLGFDSRQFPEDYILPPPYLFEMEAAGSTVITISLDKVEAPKPGTIEIQILDKDNQPVKGVELALLKVETETGTEAEGGSYSFTNAEGVAAFISEAGVYKISFLSNGFPAEYVLPEPIEVDLDSDETAKYSVKLANAATSSVKAADKKQKGKK